MKYIITILLLVIGAFAIPELNGTYVCVDSYTSEQFYISFDNTDSSNRIMYFNQTGLQYKIANDDPYITLYVYSPYYSKWILFPAEYHINKYKKLYKIKLNNTDAQCVLN